MAEHILIVDDNKELVKVYRRALERAGYKVSYAYNGRAGLKKLKEEKIDLVVLDLKMPWMSGDRFLKAIRNDPKYKDLRVLVMSSVLTKEVRVYDDFFISHLEEKPTKISQRAKKFGEAVGKFKMVPKEKRRIHHLITGPIEESDPKFKRRVSLNLVEYVKEMLKDKSKGKEEI